MVKLTCLLNLKRPAGAAKATIRLARSEPRYRETPVFGQAYVAVAVAIGLIAPRFGWAIGLPVELCGSTQIVIGQAVGRASYRGIYLNEPTLGQQVVTDVRFRVDTMLAGPAVRSLELQILGGEVGRSGASWPEEPRLAYGERYLLFLSASSDLPAPIIEHFSFLDSESTLPNEATLRILWTALCLAHAGEVLSTDVESLLAGPLTFRAGSGQGGAEVAGRVR